MPDPPRTTPRSGKFHQSPASVFPIETKRSGDDRRCRDDTDPETYTLCRTGQIEDDDQQKSSEQSACEQKQVSGGQSPELHFTADAPVDFVFHSFYRKKERKTVALTIRKMQAPNQLAAVLLVSGSPDENFW